MKSSEPADFKTDLTFWIWWRFEVVIAQKQNKKILRFTLYNIQDYAIAGKRILYFTGVVAQVNES